MRGAQRVGVVIAAVALAGCGRDSIFFEIHVPEGMAGARVELFLGMHHCKLPDLERADPDDCPGVRPPGFQGNAPLPGDVYFRDPADTTPFETFADDTGTALLEIGASAGVAHSIVIATQPGDPTAVLAAAILDDIELYKGPLKVYVDLLPASKLDQAGPGTVGALVWNSKDNTRRCVAAKNAGDPRGRFVVPDDDHDCDSVPSDKECLQLVHDAITGAANHDKPECTTAGPGPFAQACVLGGFVCDEPARQRSCEPTDYCVPDAFCQGTCRSRFDQGCVDEALPVATHIECTLHVEPDPVGGGNDLVPCTQLRGEIDLNGLGFLRPCAATNPASLSPLDLPLAFGPSLQFEMSSGMGTTDVMVMLEPNIDIGCKAEVTITGKVARDNVGTPAEPVGMVKWAVPANGGGTPAMNVLLPLWVRFEQSCGEGAASCILAPDGAGLGDAVFKCTQ